LRHFRARDEGGASSVEYGLMAVAIAALIVVIVFLLGDVVRETYFNSCEEIRAEAAPTTSCT
jgi:pilus assembly protein Flp/PilA